MQRSLGVFAICGVGICAAAQADTVTTTTTIDFCSTSCVDGISSLQPFDPTLGGLTGITLEVDASKTAIYNAYGTAFDGTSGYGSVQLAYNGPMSVTVNGTAYSFNIFGPQQNLTVGPYISSSFITTGSGTFTLDPSLFASFIGTANNCGGWPPAPLGICVNGAPDGGYDWLHTADILQSSSGAVLNVIDDDLQATFKLTYSYTPGAVTELGGAAVPEPSTWAIMLLGFAAIGVVFRPNNRKDLRRPNASVKTADVSQT